MMSHTNSLIAGYDASADHYDCAANRYWDRFSRRTLEHLAPRPGDRILDVGCGTGAFTLPAAEAVGPGGRIVAVDLSSSLLELARRKTSARGITNVVFSRQDFLSVAEPVAGYDAVVSVFSLFFAADMVEAARHLWTLVRPGGALVVTSWGTELFEPAATIFWGSIGARRPELRPARSPWDRLSSSAALRRLLEQCGPSQVDVVYARGAHRLRSADDWWTMVMGSGFRGTIERLTEDERERVRRETIAAIRAAQVRTLRCDTVYGLARKPARTG